MTEGKLVSKEEVCFIEAEIGQNSLIFGFLQQFRQSQEPDNTIKKWRDEYVESLAPGSDYDKKVKMAQEAYDYLAERAGKFHIKVE